MQREFDIIEWHARELASELNGQLLKCSNESVNIAWSELLLKNRKSDQVRKLYNTETSWNPFKGNLKNDRIQQKWNNKITKNLKKYDKINDKKVAKIKKKAGLGADENNLDYCFSVPLDSVILPGKIVFQEEEEYVQKNGTSVQLEQEREKQAQELIDKKNLRAVQIQEERERRQQELAEKKAKAKEQRELLIKQREEEKLKVQKKKEEKEEKERLKKERKEAKKLKPKRSFEPHFPRDKQLE